MTKYELIDGVTRKNTYIKDFRILGKRGKNENYSIELSNGNGTYTKITERPTIKESIAFIKSMY